MDADKINDNDLTKFPVELAERVWWVGHVQQDDNFQCHVYLIEQGDQSVLLDPGSKLTFANTLSKIEQIIPFTQIRYFICHHQDPDITGALSLIDAMNCRDDAVIISHWRAHALLKHYALNMPFWLIEEHDWQLQLQDRLLKFIFTPYAHFPGAFCTFDTLSGAMFSSDLFGGFTERFSLVAQDESYFECLRPFHEHYMPSRDVLCYALMQLEQHPIKIILPQHGSIIPQQLVDYMISRLKQLDCGLFLLTRNKTDIQRLSQLNQTLRDIAHTMIVTRDFKDFAVKLLEMTQRVLPVQSLEFYSATENGSLLHFAPHNRYRGYPAEKAIPFTDLIGKDSKYWHDNESDSYKLIQLPNADQRERHCILLPLYSPSEGKIHAMVIMHLSRRVLPGRDLSQLIEELALPLEVALERETIYRTLDLEKQRIYELSIHDPLTGLYTRQYMHDTIQRLFAIHDRDKNAQVAAAMVDVDHFKNFNDTYGHNQGDEVLREIAKKIMQSIREGDIAVRLGGEEIIVFVVGKSASNIEQLGEHIRHNVATMTLAKLLSGTSITVSIGVAVRRRHEKLIDFIGRVDRALYQAKNSGRNQVCFADDSED